MAENKTEATLVERLRHQQDGFSHAGQLMGEAATEIEELRMIKLRANACTIYSDERGKTAGYILTGKPQ